MVNAVRAYGYREAVSATEKVRKFIAGLSREDRQFIGDVVGSDIVGETKRSILRMYKKNTSRLHQAIDYRAGGLKIEIFGDTRIAPHARIREMGGIIKAFRSRFINRKTGQRLLFIPINGSDVRPREWRQFKRGVDYVLAPQVKQTGSWYMRDSVRRRLTNRGTAPTLDTKMGWRVSKIFEANSLRAR